MHGSTRKFVWGGSYQNHQYTESSKNDHALGKPAHTKLRLRGRCPPIVHGCLTKENSCPLHCRCLSLRTSVRDARKFLSGLLS